MKTRLRGLLSMPSCQPSASVSVTNGSVHNSDSARFARVSASLLSAASPGSAGESPKNVSYSSLMPSLSVSVGSATVRWITTAAPRTRESSKSTRTGVPACFHFVLRY